MAKQESSGGKDDAGTGPGYFAPANPMVLMSVHDFTGRLRGEHKASAAILIEIAAEPHIL